jgi:hypothetical protein
MGLWEDKRVTGRVGLFFGSESHASNLYKAQNLIVLPNHNSNLTCPEIGLCLPYALGTVASPTQALWRAIVFSWIWERVVPLKICRSHRIYTKSNTLKLDICCIAMEA